jgi:hypothetical protein
MTGQEGRQQSLLNTPCHVHYQVRGIKCLLCMASDDALMLAGAGMKNMGHWPQHCGQCFVRLSIHIHIGRQSFAIMPG